MRQGYFENNKYLKNRKIKINYLTKKDFDAIKIGNQNKIKNYALSFTNNKDDVLRFNKLLKKENKIFKLETKSALKNLNQILRLGKNFLIDRGDLSKDISIEYCSCTKIILLKAKIRKIFM